MVETIATKKIKLHDLKVKFGRRQVEDASFFPEWFNHLPTLTHAEKQALYRVWK